MIIEDFLLGLRDLLGAWTSLPDSSSEWSWFGLALMYLLTIIGGIVIALVFGYQMYKRGSWQNNHLLKAAGVSLIALSILTPCYFIYRNGASIRRNDSLVRIHREKAPAKARQQAYDTFRDNIINFKNNHRSYYVPAKPYRNPSGVMVEPEVFYRNFLNVGQYSILRTTIIIEEQPYVIEESYRTNYSLCSQGVDGKACRSYSTKLGEARCVSTNERRVVVDSCSLLVSQNHEIRIDSKNHEPFIHPSKIYNLLALRQPADIPLLIRYQFQDGPYIDPNVEIITEEMALSNTP